MKGEEMNTTPLRLVAIEERPPAQDGKSGTPVTVVSDQDAITRRVPESAMTATLDRSADQKKEQKNEQKNEQKKEQKNRFPLKLVLAGGAVTVVVAAGVIGLAMRKKDAVTPSSPSTVSTPVAGPVETPRPQPAPVAVLPAAAPAQRVQATGVIRLEIVAEPKETELSVDGNVMAGYRLNLDVPKDPGIHVVSASAPGYIPFNQQVSFSSDVVLKISLHRAHMPAVRQAARPRPPQSDPGPKSAIRPAAASPGSALAPGMNLDGPTPRPNVKPIDERNPYKP
jgi:hypothetical protein